jgi:hypothetical protein
VDAYRASVYVHIFFSVILGGLALFWTIMLAALGRRYDRERTLDLLAIVKTARWPHVAVPYALRVPLPWMAWVTIAVVLASGAYAWSYRSGGVYGLWWVKLALLGALIAVQALLLGRPSPWLIRANLALVLAIVVVSGWVIR